MFRYLTLPSGSTISYELVRSKVKNINLRIYPEGRIRVSASHWVSLQQIESFLCSKESFVLKALSQNKTGGEGLPAYEELPVSEAQKEAFRLLVNATVDRLLPRFDQYGIQRPDIGFHTMKSRWGSCCKEKGWVHFNYRLVFYPEKCTEYVTAHELAHLVEANHSRAFYRVLEEVMPDWRIWRSRLKDPPAEQENLTDRRRT